MKKIISILVILSLLLVGCGSNEVVEQNRINEDVNNQELDLIDENTTNEDEVELATALDLEDVTADEADDEYLEFAEYIPEYEDLEDPELLTYIEDNIYEQLILEIENENYVVENVEAKYVSKEYLEEVAYNSSSNIFFGYTLKEIEDEFQDEKFVFTNDGEKTIVTAFEDYDDTYDKMISNVMVGSGVILVCVTISAITGGAGAYAASTIFAISAKTGTTVALSSGLLSGIVSGVITGVETKDYEAAIEDGLLVGSEAFKWGAITGTVTGGISKLSALYKVSNSSTSLTMNQIAQIQKETKLPLELIDQFDNMEQYNIVKDAGLFSKIVDGKSAMVRNIDLNYVDEFGRTNLERMKLGYAALDPDGKAYELHHLGQKADSTLAILTQTEHRLNGNHTIWHSLTKGTKVYIPGNNWNLQRQNFWKSFAELVG